MQAMNILTLWHHVARVGIAAQTWMTSAKPRRWAGTS